MKKTRSRSVDWDSSEILCHCCSTKFQVAQFKKHADPAGVQSWHAAIRFECNTENKRALLAGEDTPASKDYAFMPPCRKREHVEFVLAGSVHMSSSGFIVE